MTSVSPPLVPGLGASRPEEPGPGLDPETPRELDIPRSGADRAFRGSLRAAGSAVLVITGLIALFLALRSASAFHTAGFSFFTAKYWVPAAGAGHFGVGTLLPNSAIIALVALVIAVPVALAAALFVSEYAPYGLKRPLIALIDLMAAVPSIVYALWGLEFLEPRIIGTSSWLSKHLSFIPIFKVRGETTNASFTGSMFIAGVVVSLMVIPIIASISREVFSQAPVGEREAAYALGASRWGMVRAVVLPYGRGGMIGAIMLGFGRAMGETIAVTLILNPTSDLAWRILEGKGNSITATIARYYPESTPEMISALLAAGMVLFVVTLAVNALASVIVARSRSGAQTE